MMNEDMLSGPVVLAVNAGSGSLDVQAFRIASGVSVAGQDPVAEFDKVWSLTMVRHTEPACVRITARNETSSFELEHGTPTDAVERGLDSLWNGAIAVIEAPEQVAVVGHRIVHGGRFANRHALVNTDVIEAIEDACRFAPLHNPSGLELLRCLRKILPHAGHVACFDTVFHATLDEAASVYAGPLSWLKRGYRRFGFHGIAHAEVAGKVPSLSHPAGNRQDRSFISVHFGGGCSATAIHDGRSVDTTMGLTPNEGMVMAERSGTVDPGLLIALLREENLTPDDLENMLNQESGIKGLTSGRTGDIDEARRLSDAGNRDASRAVAVYVHRACREISAVRASLSRLDAVAFSGSAIEQSPWLRKAIGIRLRFLGLDIDNVLNDAADTHDRDIATSESRTRLLVIHVDEARAIARSAVRIAL